MPVRKGLDSVLFEFRCVFVDAGTLDDYFAVFLPSWLRICCDLLCRFYDGVLAFPADFQQRLLRSHFQALPTGYQATAASR
jgi:hypothetical protein